MDIDPSHELWGTPGLETEKQRQSYNFTGTVSQVLSRKLQASLSAGFVYQTSRLSTLFHSVYLTDVQTDPNASARIERLPDSGTKFPIGLRLNYYLNDLIVLRGHYRSYLDDFGITHTVSQEAPVKVGSFFTVHPFCRYHDQTAADHFAPCDEHSPNAQYYASDYDLSSIGSTNLGLGMKYSPLYGLMRFKGSFSRKSGRITQLKSVDVRVADYTRTGNNPGNGGDLDAFSVSFDLTFTF